ncbi:hypothetical protein OIV83_004256 [Microbotryomycetes sp. JL201]|nr:hypothetical protein OIV83_004256 [Microbotryomycetes sp. JL201]
MPRVTRRRRWKPIATTLAIILTLFYKWPPLQSDLSRTVEICLVGNAETYAKAAEVYTHWHGRFPSAFYVWGEHDRPHSRATRAVEAPFIVLEPQAHEQALPFTDGLWEAVQAVTRSHRCDYIFTHDDDLRFYTGSKAKHRDHAKELVRIISRYYPAIAGFPWDVGDVRFDGMKELKAAFATKEVAPLTGFDNGMVLYHHSVLPLFFPMSPRGEGGFTGKWTLGAHFLQMFGPMVFREHAIRINTLRYNNTINMDNVAQGGAVIKDGLAYVPASRHPYEYPLNDAYQAFLRSGMHHPQQRWGRELTKADIAEPKVWKGSDYSVDWILDRVDRFYDLRHSSLSRTRLIKNAPPIRLARRVNSHNDNTTPNNAVFRITILTKNRFWSFRRLCESVRAASPITSTVLVDIQVDADPERTSRDVEAYEKYISEWAHHSESFKSVSVKWRNRPLGLRQAVLASWEPRSSHEFAILLEDDIEVSPYFLRYAENMVRSYVYRDHADARLAGISLYNPRYNEVLENFSDLAARGPPVPTNHVEVGTNDKVSNVAGRKVIEAKFTVPLLPRSADFTKLQKYPSLASLRVLTLHDAVVEDIDALPSGTTLVKTFDKCTLIMPVFSRTQTYMDRVAYYQALDDRLGQILILWSKLDEPLPTQTNFQNLAVPVEIVKMTKDSLNNRFFPWPAIKYDCVVQMDDGKPHWDMPHEHLRYGIDTWRGHFWDSLVGFSHQGRNHITREFHGEERTYYSATYLSPERMGTLRPFYSLVLTSGIIFHRKYLRKYSLDLPPDVLGIVDQRMNCEDILMNYVVANETRRGPIVIDAWAAPIVSQNNAGLWSRPGHMATRTNCIRRFNQIFGHNPLKYTTSLFPVQHEWTVPGLHHYTMSDVEPFQLDCEPEILERDEQCALQLPLPVS